MLQVVSSLYSLQKLIIRLVEVFVVRKNLLFSGLLLVILVFISSCSLLFPPSYTVTFETSGGSAVAVQEVKEGETTPKPTDPTRDDNTFSGWYSDAALSTAWEFSTIVSSNITLYAKWTAYTPVSKFSYAVINTDEIEITGFTGSETVVVIPQIIEEKPVTSIGNNVFQNKTSITNVTIPSSVTKIGDYAFFNCNSLTGIAIPEGVTSVGTSAFYYCDSITSLTIPKSIIYYGKQAFAHCDSLTSITIPEGVTTIGDYAFQYNFNLISVSIPSSLTSIGTYAFGTCNSLTSITILAGVTTIGEGAFFACTDLTSFSVDAGNTSFESVEDVLFNESKTTLIAYPAGKTSVGYSIPNGVTTIGSYAFQSCSNLTSITLPSSATSIQKYAFKYCTSLTSINIPEGVTSIGDWAFGECNSLTSITLPSSLETIGIYAFYRCLGLTSIIIPSGVTTLGKNVFSTCINITDIYCEASSKPAGWHNDWYKNVDTGSIDWGYSGD